MSTRADATAAFNVIRQAKGLPTIPDLLPALVHRRDPKWTLNCVAAANLLATGEVMICVLGVYGPLTRLRNRGVITEDQERTIKRLVFEVDSGQHDDLIPA